MNGGRAGRGGGTLSPGTCLRRWLDYPTSILLLAPIPSPHLLSRHFAHPPCACMQVL